MLNFHLVWNTSRCEWLYVCLFVFMVLSYSSFEIRSKQPRALQLLTKMLIRLCPIWEGLVLLYWNFLFNCVVWLYIFMSRAVFWWAHRARYKGWVEINYPTVLIVNFVNISEQKESRQDMQRDMWYMVCDECGGVFWLVEKTSCQSGSFNWTSNNLFKSCRVMQLPWFPQTC